MGTGNFCASGDGLQKGLLLVLARVNRDASFLYETTQFYICLLKSLDDYYHQQLSNITLTSLLNDYVPERSQKKVSKNPATSGLLEMFHNLRWLSETCVCSASQF